MVFAVAKGQHPVEEGKKGKNVRFGIHLIAGRMPGHFHSFSEDGAPSKPVRTAPTYSFLISNQSQ